MSGVPRLMVFEPEPPAVNADGKFIEACSLVDPEVMFPSEKLPNDHPDVIRAKKVCNGCAFRTECLNRALELNEQWGVWGMLSTKERHAMLRRGRRANRQPETLPGVA